MRPFTTIKALGCGLIILPLYASSPAIAESLSLNQAVAEALKNNHGIRIARNSDKAAQNNRLLAVGRFLPNAVLSAGMGRNGTDSSLALPPGFERESKATTKSLTGALSWTLFDGFRMFYAYKSLHEAADLSAISTKEKIESTVISVMQAYFSAVTQIDLLRAAEKQLAVSQDRYNRIKTRREMGQGTRVELLNSQVALNADLSNLQARQLACLRAGNSLTLAVGRAYPDSFQVMGDTLLPPVRGGLEEWLRQARVNNKRLTIQQKQKRLESLNLGMKRAAYWPVLAASGTYTLSRTNLDTGPFSGKSDRSTASVGINATWNLFNSFKDLVGVKNARLAINNAELAEKQFGLQLDALVYQQWVSIHNDYHQVGYDREAVRLSEMQLALVQEQYSLGKSGGVEFREAQLSLVNASSRLAASVFAARLALLELERLGGNIRIE